MSLDYLEDLARLVDRGNDYFACPGKSSNDWVIGTDIEALRPKAQRAADARKFETKIYRLVNLSEVGQDDSFLICKKILEPGPKGEPHLHWTLVDTKDAAELLRDVSQGPSPYFGAIEEENFIPRSQQ